MKITSKEANKLLKKLNEDYQSLLAEEELSKVFVAATIENVEECRHKYDYVETQKKLKSMQEKIRKLKHAINVFNTTTKVEGFDVTIDEILVLMPQLTKQKEKLLSMKNKNVRQRALNRYGEYGSSRIDYTYVNYDIEAVKKDYDETVDTLSRAQMALDKANTSSKIEIDFEL